MIAATIIPIVGANGDPQRAVALASMLALLVGVMTVLAGVAKLGFVADLLSKPTQIGYLNGLALTILVGQLPKLFGFSVDADGFIPEAVGFAEGLADGETVTAALAVGLLGLVLIAGFQRLVPKLPAVLVAVVVSILAANAFDLADRGVSLVGPLPRAFRRSRCRAWRCPTWRCWWPARSASRWCRSPTRSRPRRRSRPGRARRSTGTGR